MVADLEESGLSALSHGDDGSGTTDGVVIAAVNVDIPPYESVMPSTHEQSLACTKSRAVCGCECRLARIGSLFALLLCADKELAQLPDS